MKRVVLVGAVVGLVAGALIRPGTHALPDETAGDAELAAVARDLAPHGVSALAVGVVRDGEVRLASIGAPLDGEFEIGSVAKGFTGLLYADALERGEIEPTTTLGDLLDLGDAPSADVTLASIARQSSGLPRLPAGLGVFARGWVGQVFARNPYGDTNEDLVRQLRATRVGEPEPLYSNFGFEALGLALAEAAGTTYPELVRRRIAEPLGLENVSVPATVDELTDRAVQGRDSSGRRQQAWTGEAIGPAGGIRSDIADLTALAAALLDGSAPGADALEPVADFEDGRIGAAWFTDELSGRPVTWHNGGTGGFRAWVGLDREASTAVVVLAATSTFLDDLGLAILDRETGR